MITILIIAALIGDPTANCGSIDDTVGFDGDLDAECLYFDRIDDSDTYMCLSTANEVTLTCGAANVWVCDASGCTLTGSFEIEGDVCFGDDEQLKLGNTCSAPDYWVKYNSTNTAFEIITTDSDAGGGTNAVLLYADDGTGYIVVGTRSQGIRLDGVSEDGVLTLRTEGGSDAGIDVGPNGYFQHQDANSRCSRVSSALLCQYSAGSITRMSADIDTADFAIFTVDTTDASEMNDTDGEQFAMRILPEYDQSGTAVATALMIDVITTGVVGTADSLIKADWGNDDIIEWRLADTGDMHQFTQKGASTNYKTKTESVTFANDASKTTTGTALPKYTTILAVTGRVTTALTGCTSVDVGDGSDVDIFADDMPVAVDGTFGGETDTKGPTASFGNPQLSDGEITVTANGGNCTGGVVALTTHYIGATAATSN